MENLKDVGEMLAWNELLLPYRGITSDNSEYIPDYDNKR